jgi:tetratricopeptide (TPR) repeat protein
MRSARTTQIIITALVAGLAAFLFLSGKNNSSALTNSQVHANAKEESSTSLDNNGFNFALLEKDIKSKLSKKDNDEIMLLESEQAGRGKTLDYTVKLAEKYDHLNQPAVAGYYYQKVAEEKSNDEKYWALTGKKFFEAQQTVTDTPTFQYFVNLSMNAYEKALALNPNDLDAQIDQAVNLVEGKGQVMQGVGMLKKVEQLQPDNRRMLFYLGVLSMQSGQTDKAVTRFEKLTTLPREKGDKLYPYYFRYLGQAYQALQQNDKALSAFTEYKKQISTQGDKALIQEADQLINSVQ